MKIDRPDRHPVHLTGRHPALRRLRKGVLLPALLLAPHLPGSALAAEASAPARMVIAATISGELAAAGSAASLPAGAEAVVQLLDHSETDPAKAVIAEHRFPVSGQPPFAYRIDYDAVRINPRHAYRISARVAHDGKLLLTTPTPAPVITEGSSGIANLQLKAATTP